MITSQNLSCHKNYHFCLDLGRGRVSVAGLNDHPTDHDDPTDRPLPDILQHRRQAVLSSFHSTHVRPRLPQLPVRLLRDVHPVRDRPPPGELVEGRRIPAEGDREEGAGPTFRHAVYGPRARYQVHGRCVHHTHRSVYIQCVHKSQ